MNLEVRVLESTDNGAFLLHCVNPENDKKSTIKTENHLTDILLELYPDEIESIYKEQKGFFPTSTDVDKFLKLVIKHLGTKITNPLF